MRILIRALKLLIVHCAYSTGTTKTAALIVQPAQRGSNKSITNAPVSTAITERSHWPHHNGSLKQDKRFNKGVNQFREEPCTKAGGGGSTSQDGNSHKTQRSFNEAIGSCTSNLRTFGPLFIGQLRSKSFSHILLSSKYFSPATSYWLNVSRYYLGKAISLSFGCLVILLLPWWWLNCCHGDKKKFRKSFHPLGSMALIDI